MFSAENIYFKMSSIHEHPVGDILNCSSRGGRNWVRHFFYKFLNCILEKTKCNIMESKIIIFFSLTKKQSSLYQIETTKLSIIINLEITSCQ